MKNSKFRSFKKCILYPTVIILIGIGLISFLAPSLRNERTSLKHDGLRRTFKIYLPSSYDKSVKLPLLVALHGRGGNGSSMIIITRKGFNKLANRDGFIVVYPDGVKLNWNDGRMDEESKDRAHRENIDDVGFISALIDLMIKEYKVDPKCIYITGISNGAIMSYRLACELSDRITAIAPVNGNIPQMLYTGCSPSGPVSVLAINNINDPLVPYEGGEIVGGFRKVKLGKVLSVDESIGFWVKHNKCSPVSVVTLEPDIDPEDGTRVTRKVFINNNDGNEVILYSIDGGGHTWPGGVQYKPSGVIGKTCRDFDANEVIWAFFKGRSK